MGTVPPAWSFPGKVMVIDDRFDEEVRNFILDMSNRGIPVQYWDGKKDLEYTPTNVRVIFLDLDLSGGVVRRGEPTYYFLAAAALNKIKGPYLIIIWSSDFTDEDKENLRDYYKQLFEESLCGFIIGKGGFTKASKRDELYSMMEEALHGRLSYQLILAWERLLDRAKDEGLGELSSGNLENTMHSFVRIVARDVVGNEPLPREFISTMMRIISRYMNSGEDLEKVKTILNKLTNSPSDAARDELLHHLRLFYHPHPKEEAFTGDIILLDENESGENSQYWKYGIILTPACDLVNSKADTLLVCKGLPLSYAALCDMNHPYRKLNKRGFKPGQADKEADEDKKRDLMNQTLKESISNRPDRIYPIFHFQHQSDEYFGICFDFQRIFSLDREAIKLDKRICRLDSPTIEDLLQKYGAYSSRLGTTESIKP